MKKEMEDPLPKELYGSLNISLFGLLKNISTWDLIWFHVKMSFAAALAIPVFMAVAIFWMYLIALFVPSVKILADTFANLLQ